MKTNPLSLEKLSQIHVTWLHDQVMGMISGMKGSTSHTHNV